jgi:DMSO/TMAO reductase YedYZ heme-binding membrane subunit
MASLQSGTRTSALNGWRLTGLIALSLLAMCAAGALLVPDRTEAIRLLIRMTARTSLLLFLLAFTASALARLAPSAASRWVRANRRYIGVSFAISHGLHLAAIVALARQDPALFDSLTSPVSLIGGGFAYVLIALMAATSFDSTARLIGPRAWRLLHLTGSWVVWIIFLNSYGRRALENPVYIPPVALLLLAVTLRLWAARARRAAA